MIIKAYIAERCVYCSKRIPRGQEYIKETYNFWDKYPIDCRKNITEPYLPTYFNLPRENWDTEGNLL